MLARITRNGALRMEWAVVETFDRALQAGRDVDEFTDFGVHRVDVCLGESAARDAALIRGDDEAEASITQAAKCRGNAVKDADIRGIASKLVIGNEGAVTVEEDCWFHACARRSLGSA